MEDVIAHFGKIDILVNSGGTGGSGDPATMTDEQWAHVVDTDLTGLFYLCRDVARLSMIPNNYGRIVNVSSIHGFVSRKNVWTAPYCASKGGVHMMTKAMANDWGKYNITVNCIAPGYFPTELTEKFIDSDALCSCTRTAARKSATASSARWTACVFTSPRPAAHTRPARSSRSTAAGPATDTSAQNNMKI